MLGEKVNGRIDLRGLRRQIGYLPQEFGYYRRFTVREFVEYIAWLKEMPAAETPGAVQRAIERVGLADRADDRMKTLSGGMVRRAGIAQAIVNDPRILLLDEPTAGLDPDQRMQFRALLRELGTDTCVLVSTHLVEDVAAACTDVVLIDDGPAGLPGRAGRPRRRGRRGRRRRRQRRRARLLGHPAPPPRDGGVMGARILRIELRRSVALWAALLIAAVGVFVLVRQQPAVRVVDGAGHRSARHAAADLAAGAGGRGLAGHSASAAPGSRSCSSTTPRPRRRRVLPVATAMAIAAVAAYLVMLAGGAGHLRHLDAYFPPGAVPLIVLGALAMVAAVWLGLAIGALLPSPLTAPMLAVIGFLALALLPSHRLVRLASQRRARFLLFPQLAGPRDGASRCRCSPRRANLSQALWLVALAATGLALFAAARPGTRLAAVLPS